MKFNQLFFIPLLLLLSISLSIQPMSMPGLTPDDQKLLAELDQEINKFVESLPPEAQKQFWQDVDELSKEMSKMKPEELDAFVQSVFQDNVLPEPEPVEEPEQPIEQPVAKPVTQPEQPKAIAKSTSIVTINELVDLLDTVIAEINNLLKKAQIIPDFDGKVESWISKGRIATRADTKNWAKLKNALEGLTQKLYKAKDRDQSTKQYKYLEKISGKKELIEIFKNLECDLCQCVPLISVGDIAEAKTNKTSVDAIQKSLNTVSNALFVSRLDEELEKVFAEYATEQGKKEKKTPTSYKEKPGRTVGSSSSAAYGYNAPRDGSRATQDFYGGADYSPAYYSPYDDSSYYSPSEQAQDVPSGSFGGNDTSKLSTGGKTSAPSSSTKEKEKKEGTTETKKEADNTSGQSSKSTEGADTVAEGYFDEISFYIEEAMGIIKQYPDFFGKLEKYLTDSQTAVNIDIATSGLSQAVKKIQKAADKMTVLVQRIKRLKSKSLGPKYAKEFTSGSLKKNLEEFEKVASEITKMSENWSKIQGSISADKQYAFFGGMKEPADQNLKQTIPLPSSVYELQAAIDKLNTGIKDLKKK